MSHQIEFPFNGSYIKVFFDKDNICILDSYKVKRSKDMKQILENVFYASVNRGIFYSRSIKSWLKEWKAHNILYKFGLFRSHTKDVDLTEKESKKRRFAYFILSLFYWK